MSLEPAMSPREKAKRATKARNVQLGANGSAGIVPDTTLPNLGDDVRKPFSNITTTATTNKLATTTIDILTVPSSIRDRFAYFRTKLQSVQEEQLLLDWLALECEDEAKAVSACLLFFLPPN